MKKRVIILGSTGSIGCNTLDVLDALADEWDVVALGAGESWQRLGEQANRHHPTAIALANDAAADRINGSLSYAPRVFSGRDALTRLVSEVECDCVVSAVVGVAGVEATLRAVELGRRVALANKEALVIAGAILMPLAESSGATIIPVDSEHSGVFQALHAGRRAEVRRVYLTASGGPFRTWSQAAIQSATVADALQHPTWEMGPKITIDSATMMNKALEVVEACWLFDLPPERIRVVVHPESIIHSVVEFCDGSMIAQLGVPDMRTPIQYALTYPERRSCPPPELDLAGVGALHLEAPDGARFPALNLGYVAAEKKATYGAVLNAANEAAVELFRDGSIPFGGIARSVERAMNLHEPTTSRTLDDLLAADRWARREVMRCTAC